MDWSTGCAESSRPPDDQAKAYFSTGFLCAHLRRPNLQHGPGVMVAKLRTSQEQCSSALATP